MQACLVLWTGKQCVSSAESPCPGEDQQKQYTQIVSEEAKGLVMIALHLDFLRAQI